MDLKIAGRNALVMGGSRGIGRAISLRLAREGCNVGIVARGRESLDETVAAIEADGGKAVDIAADITNYGGYGALLDAYRAAFGPPDIIVYSPPTPGTGEILKQDVAGLLGTYNDLVLCFFELARLTIPDMQAKQWGRFVTVGSASIKSPRVGQAGVGFHYALGNINRMAAMRLSKQLAYEVGKDGITLNTIGTGTFRTETFEKHWGAVADEMGVSFEEMVDRQLAAIPVGRLGTVEDMADLAAYLCSDLSGFTTGETILCDGGKFVAAL